MEGNNRVPKTLSPSLPPGCRFYPSDEQLCYYLKNKNHTIPNDTDDVNGNDLIKELDLYDYDPFDLPGNACFAYGCKARKRHWYCYTKKEQVRVMRREAKGGYWRRSGKVRDVVVGPGGKAVMGTRTRFVFYSGNSAKSAVRTGWVLYEYALVDHAKASFVLCRVFVKSRRGNSISENVVSSCAEESVSAVRTIGAHHDGFLTPDIAEVKVHDDHVNMQNDLSRYSARLGRDFDDQVTTRPTSISSFQFPSNSQCNEAVRRTSGPTDGNMYVDAETALQLRSILEGDFIELDDLVD